MQTYKDFLKECMRLPADEKEFGFWIVNCRNDLKDKSAVKAANTVESEHLTMVTAGVKKCLKYIADEEKHVKSLSDDTVFAAFKKILI